jgi:hypothetical protein
MRFQQLVWSGYACALGRIRSFWPWISNTFPIIGDLPSIASYSPVRLRVLRFLEGS